MDSGQWVNFSLTAAVGPSNTSIWAAVGFSRDIYMVCVCVCVWGGGGGGGGGRRGSKEEGEGEREKEEKGEGDYAVRVTPIHTDENFRDE